MDIKNNNNKYCPEQVWSYHTRPGENDSFLTILKIDQFPSSTSIFHIRLDNLKIKSRYSPNMDVTEVAHIPISQDAFERSIVTKLRQENTIPDFSDGYQGWKQAFDEQKAGIYTIDIKDIVGVIEDSLNH